MHGNWAKSYYNNIHALLVLSVPQLFRYSNLLNNIKREHTFESSLNGVIRTNANTVGLLFISYKFVKGFLAITFLLLVLSN